MTCRRDAKLRGSFDGERVCKGPLLITFALEIAVVVLCSLVLKMHGIMAVGR